MEALVVYESMFGNTKALAEAIADGLSSRMNVRTVEVGGAPTRLPEGLDMLVLGCPTHAFGMSRASTREDAAKDAAHGLVSRGIGMREWLDSVDPGRDGPATAVFDTRVNRPRLPGSAASAAEKKLKRLGFNVITRPMSFYVDGKVGPLIDGELERATLWAKELGIEFMPVA